MSEDTLEEPRNLFYFKMPDSTFTVEEVETGRGYKTLYFKEVMDDGTEVFKTSFSERRLVTILERIFKRNEEKKSWAEAR